MIEKALIKISKLKAFTNSLKIIIFERNTLDLWILHFDFHLQMKLQKSL